MLSMHSLSVIILYVYTLLERFPETENVEDSWVEVLFLLTLHTLVHNDNVMTYISTQS